MGRYQYVVWNKTATNSFSDSSVAQMSHSENAIVYVKNNGTKGLKAKILQTVPSNIVRNPAGSSFAPGWSAVGTSFVLAGGADKITRVANVMPRLKVQICNSLANSTAYAYAIVDGFAPSDE